MPELWFGPNSPANNQREPDVESLQAYCLDNYNACTHNDPSQRKWQYSAPGFYMEPAPDYTNPTGRGRYLHGVYVSACACPSVCGWVLG